jgi:hypothetical protein
MSQIVESTAIITSPAMSFLGFISVTSSGLMIHRMVRPYPHAGNCRKNVCSND